MIPLFAAVGVSNLLNSGGIIGVSDTAEKSVRGSRVSGPAFDLRTARGAVVLPDAPGLDIEARGILSLVQCDSANRQVLSARLVVSIGRIGLK